MKRTLDSEMPQISCLIQILSCPQAIKIWLFAIVMDQSSLRININLLNNYLWSIIYSIITKSTYQDLSWKDIEYVCDTEVEIMKTKLEFLEVEEIYNLL